MSKAKLYFRNEKTTDTWLTPLELIKPLGMFDLDPCAFPGHKTAKRLYCLPKTDGLKTKWGGNARIWLNPPYGSECGKWVDKLARHGRGTALVFARIETRWFQRAVKEASAILFPSSRVRFLRASAEQASNASAPSAFIAFGEDDALALEFSGIEGWFVKCSNEKGRTP